MKTSFAALIILVLSITSCQKETMPTLPNTPATITKYQVEMVVYAMSSDATIKYTQPDGEKLPINTVLANRQVTRLTFEAQSNMNLSIDAYNTTPSKEEIIIELFIDGKFMKSTSVNSIGAIASMTYFLK